MITLIYGENAYERDQQLAATLTTMKTSHRYDGEQVAIGDLPQLLTGLSLFSSTDTPVVMQLSDNKPVWSALGEYLESIENSDDVSLILVEAKPDKRTRTFKYLQKKAHMIECKPYGDRDQTKVLAWLESYAKKQSIQLEKQAAQELIRRIGTDQYALLHEVERLSNVGKITLKTVKTYTEETLHDTAFDLLATALRGDTQKLHQKIQLLQTTEDPYMTMGLLISQVYVLAGIVTSNGEAVAVELGVHPFVLRQLQPIARSIDESRLHSIVNEFALIDSRLKSISRDQWLVIESSLSSIANT